MKIVLILASVMVLVFGLTGCNFPGAQGTDDSIMQTAVALNVALTQVAATLTSLAPGVVDTQSPPTAELPTATSEFTATITNTPEPTITPTPEGVWLSVLENTNCRVGPGSNYARVVTINEGEQVEAVAASTIDEYFYVKNPYANGYCWLWSEYSTVTGNVTSLPVYTPQPTPTVASATPTADFVLSYVGMESCAGDWAVLMKITNTGSITWQSIVITVKDKSTSDVFTHQKTEFRGVSGCAVQDAQSDLTAGEESYIANVSPGQITYNPNGHELKITVTLYSKDNYTGTSVTKTLTITP